MNKPVKIIIYIRGGLCQDVITNLPEDCWDYIIVDYDNEPDLSNDYIPFSPAEMRILPSMVMVENLIQAATSVVDNWETGDLAGSVRQMAVILAQMDSVPQDTQNRYTVFGYHTEHQCPFGHWVAANNVDEAKTVIAQQYPAVAVCGVVKGWIPLD